MDTISTLAMSEQVRYTQGVCCVRKRGPDRSYGLTNVLKQRGIAVMTEEEERMQGVPSQRGAWHW